MQRQTLRKLNNFLINVSQAHQATRWTSLSFFANVIARGYQVFLKSKQASLAARRCSAHIAIRYTIRKYSDMPNDELLGVGEICYG